MQSSQPCDDVLRDAVAEVLLFRVVARFANGRTAIEGLSATGRDGRDATGVASVAVAAGFPSLFFPYGPNEARIPLRGNVLIRRCASPLSPIAVRAALMQVVSANSETMRPFQMAATRSSLLTTRSRF